ncbi:MAG: glycosyltransferase family 4 protein [Lachnospiraceae bacterium]|nr:glycosyltransferase family 4 protein [Lachnospiraceae bacterium]
MKIFIDISVLTLATFVTGIQRVTTEFIIRLLQHEEFEVILLHYNAAKDSYYRIDNQSFFNYYALHKGIKEKMISKTPVPLSDMQTGTIFFDLDASWMCPMKRSYLLPLIKKQGATIVAHVYDIISITHPQYCLERGVYYFMDFIGAHLQFADCIITNAQATVNELQKLTEQLNCQLPSCHVVPLGSDFRQQNTIDESQVSQQLADIVKSRPYLLMVGTLEPRKNHKLLLDAYESGLKDLGYNIIMAGYMGWNMDSFEKRLTSHPDYNSRIFHFEGLDDKAISYLYQNTKFLVFCSYTEGFGLPIVEALQRGVRVLAADVPVLREVGKDSCIWFEQDSPTQLCEQIKRYENHSKADTDLSALKHLYTWDECAKQVSDILLSYS